MSETQTERVFVDLEADLSGPAVVAIGGGHGLAQALQAIKYYAGRITAVVGVADNGGSSGRLADVVDMPPPGDLRMCLLALAAEQSPWREVFAHRFHAGDVAGHSLGNLLLAAWTELHGDFEAAVRTAERYLGAVGEVIPAAQERLHMEATVDGTTVTGQLAVARARGMLTDLRLLPPGVPANPRAIRAVAEADQIVLGPGSLYTSLIAPLTVGDLAAAVNRSQAQLVWVANLMTQDGETIAMSGESHMQALMEVGGLRPPDVIVAQESDLAVDAPLEPVRIDDAAAERIGSRLVLADLCRQPVGLPLHDPIQLGLALSSLIGPEGGVFDARSQPI